MKLTLRLAWLKAGAPAARGFKLPGAFQSVEEYSVRLMRSLPFSVEGGEPSPGSKVWLLDRGPGAKALSSEEVAAALGREKDGGTRSLEVVVGPPDGFTPADVARQNPSLRWSFGPLTLPHELAAVVAAEQLYRALSILSRSPYHLGH